MSESGLSWMTSGGLPKSASESSSSDTTAGSCDITLKLSLSCLGLMGGGGDVELLLSSDKEGRRGPTK